MKKSRSLIVIILCLALMACSNNKYLSTTVEQKDTPAVMGEDLSQFIVEYDGDIYKMPILVSELLDNGWKVKTDNSTAKVPANDSGIAYLTKNNITINTRPKNYSDTPIAIENCYITSLIGNNSSLKVPITLSKDITIGMRQSELEASLEDIDYDIKEHYSLIYYHLKISDSNREYIDLILDKDLDSVSEIVVSCGSIKNND